MCATVKASLVCREVCEQLLWRKEKERQIQFALCLLVWRSNYDTLSDRVAIFIEDFSLIFLQSGRWDCLLEVCRSVRNFVNSCCPQEVPVTVNLGCFENPTVKYSPIALKFLLEFITHIKWFWTDGFEIGAVVCFHKIRERCLLFWWRDFWTLPY